VLDKLAQLEINIAELERLRERPTAVMRDRWALRYGLIESIQIVIDVSCEIVARAALGTPATYRQCIELLAGADLLPSDLAARLGSMVGLRNLLVHEYDEIDESRLLSALNHLDDLRAFAQAVSEHP
jgi:uncharacterized protein YutE (UPF0331/DUF86 family)